MVKMIGVTKAEAMSAEPRAMLTSVDTGTYSSLLGLFVSPGITESICYLFLQIRCINHWIPLLLRLLSKESKLVLSLEICYLLR